MNEAHDPASHQTAVDLANDTAATSHQAAQAKSVNLYGAQSRLRLHQEVIDGR